MATSAKEKPRLTLRDTTDLFLELDRYLDEHVDEIEMNGGALPDDLAALLDEIALAHKNRVDALAAKLDEFAGLAATAKATKDRAARREKVWTNTAAAIKKYVLHELERLAVDRIIGATAVLRRQINSAPAVECTLTPEQLMDICDDDEPHPLVPYLTVKREAVLDRKALAVAYLARREQLEAETPLLDESALTTLEWAQVADFGARADGATAHDEAEAVQWILEQKRRAYIADNLAAEFPGITVTRGYHVRID